MGNLQSASDVCWVEGNLQSASDVYPYNTESPAFLFRTIHQHPSPSILQPMYGSHPIGQKTRRHSPSYDLASEFTSPPLPGSVRTPRFYCTAQGMTSNRLQPPISAYVDGAAVIMPGPALYHPSLQALRQCAAKCDHARTHPGPPPVCSFPRRPELSVLMCVRPPSGSTPSIRRSPWAPCKGCRAGALRNQWGGFPGWRCAVSGAMRARSLRLATSSYT